MYEWFNCHLPGCGGFIEYFSFARPRTTLAFRHLRASSEAELLDLNRLITEPMKWFVRPAKVRVFTVRMKIAWLLSYTHSEDSDQTEGSDQTGRMPRLIYSSLGTKVILLVLS